jgi:hypothetical protein
MMILIELFNNFELDVSEDVQPAISFLRQSNETGLVSFANAICQKNQEKKKISSGAF